MTIEHLLAAARAGLRRLDPAEAAEAVRAGARLVDTRPEFQRQADGEIPGAIVIERNHLEWRLDPTSAGRIPEATDDDVAWICSVTRATPPPLPRPPCSDSACATPPT
jgi:hypothetical protein